MVLHRRLEIRLWQNKRRTSNTTLARPLQLQQKKFRKHRCMQNWHTILTRNRLYSEKQYQQAPDRQRKNPKKTRLSLGPRPIGYWKIITGVINRDPDTIRPRKKFKDSYMPKRNTYRSHRISFGQTRRKRKPRRTDHWWKLVSILKS